MIRRCLVLLVVVALLVPLLAAPSGMAVAHAPANDPFYDTWARSDLPVSERESARTWMWGPRGNTPALVEDYADAPGGQRVVQYFDKTRMEINKPNGDKDDPWYVTNGLLATELVTGERQVGDDLFHEHGPAEIPVAGDRDNADAPTYATMNLLLEREARTEGAVIVEQIDRSGTVTVNDDRARFDVRDAYFVPQTGHNVASVFWDFMNSTGTIMENGDFSQGSIFPDPFFATGYPITEAYWTTVRVGGEPRDVLVQVFQRRVLTFTPGNPEGWEVEAGNVGRHYYHWVYEVLGDAAQVTPASDPGGSSQPAQEPGADSACLGSFELEFLALINDYRQQNGLDPLQNSAALNVASHSHSDDMGRRGYFSHNSPDGERPVDRMDAAGYSYNTSRGENIAAGHSTAERVFEAWRESPGHNANMLSTSYSVIGIGRVEVPDSHYGVYWTTKFGGYVDQAPDC